MENNPNPIQPTSEPTPEPTVAPEPTVVPEPTVAPEPTAAPEPTPTPDQPVNTQTTPQPQVPQAQELQPKKKRNNLVIGIIVGLIVAVAIATPIILLLVVKPSEPAQPSGGDSTSKQHEPDGDQPDDKPPVTSKNHVSGIWNCAKGIASANDPKSFNITIKLNEDMSFVYGPYNDTDNNHFSGTYTYKDENKHTNDYKYNYYMVDFNTDEYISDGEKQDITNTTSQMYMGIAESGNCAGRQAIIIFVSSYNRYYCYDYSDPTNLTITHFRNPLAPRPSID